MNIFRTCVVLILVLAFIAMPSTILAADTPSAAMLKIAEIMHRLKHFPSPGGKTTLHALASKSTTTSNEKAIIQAMLNLQHQVSSADRGKLMSLLKDNKANKDESSIATILLNLDHRPTKQDKAILKKILEKM